MSEDQVRKAEREVQRSTAEFDRAMKHLEEKVEDTGRKMTATITSVRETIYKPVRVFENYRDKARLSIDRGKNLAVEYGQKARERPDLLWSAVGLLCGVSILLFALKGRRKASQPELTSYSYEKQRQVA